MWERFNFYGMRTILSLFLSEALVMGDKQASIIYGGYLGLCYLTPMLGGYISDRFLGNRNCILLGGLTMMIGQFMLFGSASIFHENLSLATSITWSALGVIILGNGFFKPNISSMVGQLYPKDQKTKLDSAFTIFYMGINVGALLGQFICPLVGDVINVVDGKEVRDLSAFKWGFLAAGIAMFLGTTSFFFLKNRYVVTPEGKAIGGRPEKQVAHGEESNRAHFTSSSVVILLVSAVILYFLFQYFAWDPVDMPMKRGGLGGYFMALTTSPVETFIYPLIYSLAIALAIFNSY
jgi:POT family proton-dependent oligopeptide transporter